MDALESIGMRQMTDNLDLMDFYRMKDNKLSFMETKEALPHLDKIGDLADKLGDMPSFIKHYDLLGTIVNAFVGQLTNLSSKYSVVGTDEDEVNEYMDTKQDILIDYVRKAWDIRLRQKMLAQGMDPDYNDFQSEEERRAYVDASARSDVNPLGEWTKYDGNNFYYAVKPQIDEMFVCYPEEEILVSTVPNSKWVRVDAEDGYYVGGLLYDENEPSFICYGVPQIKSDALVKAPPELQNMCVWLPVNVSESVSGYWIIYQSAKTGEIIK